MDAKACLRHAARICGRMKPSNFRDLYAAEGMFAVSVIWASFAMGVSMKEYRGVL